MITQQEAFMTGGQSELVASGRAMVTWRRRSWRGWQFVGPFMVVFALVFLAPIAYSIYLSLFQTRLIGGTSFVGLDNYKATLTDQQFWSAFERVALFLVVQV